MEDNFEVRKLMRYILVGLGYSVLEAARGEEAIQVAEKQPIDLMVSDVVMPGLSGFELAKRLAPIRPNMRVLFVSGYANLDAVTREPGDPSVAYLQKPFLPAELASKVAELISRRKESGPFTT